MQLTLADFRNVLGNVNDGSVVFTKDAHSNNVGIEKANYGWLVKRNIKAMTPEENRRLRQAFFDSIVSYSGLGCPISKATLDRIQRMLGLGADMNGFGDLCGMPLNRRDIKTIIDIVDDLKEDCEIIKNLGVGIDGYTHAEFVKLVNESPILSGTNDLKSVLPKTFNGFKRAEVAKCVGKNIALLKALVLDEMTWHYEGTRRKMDVAEAFRISLAKMMHEFAAGRTPVTRTRQLFAEAQNPAPLQDNEGTAQEFFEEHGLMPEKEIDAILTDGMAVGCNVFSQTVLVRAVKYVKKAFVEDFQKCINENGNSAQAAQAAYDARTLPARTMLAELANDVRNIAFADPSNLAKFRADLASNLLANFRSLNMDPSTVGADTFRAIFMVALSKTVAPFSMRSMAQAFAQVSAHEDFKNGEFKSTYLDDFSKRVAALPGESGIKGAVANWQSQAFLAAHEGKPVPKIGNNLKHDALEKLYDAFKKELDEADPALLAQKRRERNRAAAMEVLGDAAQRYGEERLNSSIKGVYMKFYESAHGMYSLYGKDMNPLPQDVAEATCEAWMMSASDDEIAFLVKFCKLGLNNADAAVMREYKDATNTKLTKPPLYAALRDAGDVLEDMNAESSTLLRVILKMGVAQVTSTSKGGRGTLFMGVMSIIGGGIDSEYQSSMSFMKKIFEEIGKANKERPKEFSQAQIGVLRDSRAPAQDIQEMFKESGIFDVKGFGTIDPLKIIRLLQRAGISLNDFARSDQAKRADACSRLLTLMHFARYNNYDLKSLPEYVQRVTGKGIAEVSFSDYVLFARKDREKVDVVPRGSEAVVNVLSGKVGLAEARLEENDVYVLRDAFASLQEPGAKPVTVTLVKNTVTLELLEDGGVRATLKTGNKPGDIKQYRLAQSAADSARTVDDIIVAHARDYKPGIVASVLPPLPNTAHGDSLMRAREIYAKTICAFTGRSPVDYAAVPTDQLRQIALDAVAKKPLPPVATEPPQTYNSAEMIEMHKNLGKITVSEVDAKVTIQSDGVRRSLDSRQKVPPTAAEFRSLVADFFLNEDTWAFDAQAGSAKGERIRKLVLANSHELKFVFADIAGFVSHLAPEMRDQMAAILTALKDIPFDRLQPDENGAVDEATMGTLAEVEGLVEGLVKAYAETMQKKVTDLFAVQNAGGAAKPLQYQTFAEISGISGLNPDTPEGRFTLDVLGRYFSMSAAVDKRAMLAAMVRNTDNSSSDAKMVAELLKGAGPLLQKMLQGLPPGSFGPETRVALKDMKSRLAPIPAEAVKAQLLELVNSSNGEILSVDVKKVLGAASVGEALLCHIKTKDCPVTGVDCVIKVLRPSIHTAILREKAIFDKIIADTNPAMAGSFQRRYEGILKEFDLTIEADNIRLGRTHYEHPTVDGTSVVTVRSMLLVDNVSPSTGTLVVEKADGVTYDKFIDDIHNEADETIKQVEGSAVEKNGRVTRSIGSARDLLAIRRRLEYLKAYLGEKRNHIVDFASAWFENGIYGDGFMHGDLHAGNIMLSDEGATIIDFGNCIRLTKEEQEKVRTLFSKASLGFGEDAIKTFVGMLPEAEAAKLKNLLAQNEGFKKNLFGVFTKGTALDVMSRIYAAMNIMQRQGVEIPGSINNFFQSFSRLNDIFQTMTDEMLRIDGMIDTLVLDENAFPAVDENAPALVKDFVSFVGMISSNQNEAFDYVKFATIANGYVENKESAIMDSDNKEYGGKDNVGVAGKRQIREALELLKKNPAQAKPALVPFFRWLAEMAIPYDRSEFVRKPLGKVNAQSFPGGSKRDEFEKAIEIIAREDVAVDSQEYLNAVSSLENSLAFAMSYFAQRLADIMDATPVTSKKISGLKGVVATRNTSISEVCGELVADKMRDSSNFMGMFKTFLLDFPGRFQTLSVAIRENMRFEGKLEYRKAFAVKTLSAGNRELAEEKRLTLAERKVLMRQMESFAWPFEGAWSAEHYKGPGDAVHKLRFGLPEDKRAVFLEALAENLDALRSALGYETLPPEVARLAITYLAQIDPRAAQAVKSLDEAAYSSFLAQIGQAEQSGLLAAAVDALRTAPDDAALFADNPSVEDKFRTVDKNADLIDISFTGGFKMFKSLVSGDD